jgi:multicomponent Na+:H+ antiporter subunit F
MIGFIIVFLVVLCLVCLYRVIRGPTLLDRLAAADAIGIMLTVTLVLIGLRTGRDLFLDIALVYSLLLFADVLIIAKYIERRDITR